MKTLFIVHVWPEPTSSAAGVRTTQLIKLLKESGFQIHICSPCSPNPFKYAIEELEIPTSFYAPNDSSFDKFIKDFKPELVIFDRFMTEEMFSFRVREHAPNAIRILDSIDLHSLRRIREQRINSGLDPYYTTEQELNNEDFIREVSSIYRSDTTLLVSDYELEFLKNRFGIDTKLLSLVRLFYKESLKQPSFEDRKNFVTIGNFNHPPNLDSLKILSNVIWPRLRAKFSIQEAPEMHIYGSYPNNKALEFDSAKLGFRIKGSAEDAQETLSKYRVNLAPLRFGAGIKGKIADGFVSKTPCVTTKIGAEGMHQDYQFPGFIVDDWEEFSTAAHKLYTDAPIWNQYSNRCSIILKEVFSFERNSKELLEKVAWLSQNLEKHRASNKIGNMLWYQKNRSTEYFSRWIEAKSKL